MCVDCRKRSHGPTNESTEMGEGDCRRPCLFGFLSRSVLLEPLLANHRSPQFRSLLKLGRLQKHSPIDRNREIKHYPCVRKTAAPIPIATSFTGLVYSFSTHRSSFHTFSFNDSRFSAVWSGFTWRWYGLAWRDAELIAPCALVCGCVHNDSHCDFDRRQRRLSRLHATESGYEVRQALPF